MLFQDRESATFPANTCLPIMGTNVTERSPRETRRPAGLVAALTSAIAVAVIGTAAIGTASEDVVAERQNDMKLIAASAKTMAEMFKSPGTYASAAFRQAAQSISTRADRRLADHFSKVTVSEGSKAAETIAGDPERFAALAKDLKTYADALAVAAESHPGEMTDDMRMKQGEAMGGGPLGTRLRDETQLSKMSAEHAFHLMLQTCTTCHARFRKE